jgi:hypothetical protein
MSNLSPVFDRADGSAQMPDRRYDDGWESDFPRLPPEASARNGIIDGLDRMAPGPILGTYLATINVAELSGYDRVVVLRAHQRMVSHYQAKLYDDMVAVREVFTEAGDDPLDASMTAASEIRAAMNLTRRSADIELSFALDLAQRLPRVLQMLGAGVIDWRRARAIEAGTCHLSMASAQDVVDRVAESAPSMTTGQIAAWVRKMCMESYPEEAKERYEKANATRRVVMQPMVDGTANLQGLELAPDRVAAAARRINGIAKGLRGESENRTMDQIRADVFLDLLEGHHRDTKGTSVVHINVDLDTLAGLTEHAGELAGYGPVISDIARQVADLHQGGEWRWSLNATENNEYLCGGTTRRRPDAAQRRHIQSRDRNCIFPGCRVPAIDCDIDHTTPWAEGGATCPCNNAIACRHDHRLKERGWSYLRLDNGQYQWTSPLGHTYTTWRSPP